MTIIRIKFNKDDSVKFISHLDMMKTFQRAVRRAGLDAEYSQGFNPQMQMIFGAPLSLGFTSSSEFADLSFSGDYKPAFVMEKLNEALPGGLKVLDAGLRTIKKNIMADIKYAGYDFNIESDLSLQELADRIIKAESLTVPKTRKGKTKDVDIRPLVINVHPEEKRMRILVRAGNEKNLNPRLLLDAISLHIDPEAEGTGYNRYVQYVERDELRTDPLAKNALSEM